MEKIKWCLSCHSGTNHMYDTYLPYEFHLRMVANVASEFKHLLDDTVDYYGHNQVDTTLRTACLERFGVMI